MSRDAGQGSGERRRATLLDVPWIFDLMLEGASDGVFSDKYLARAGTTRLLKYILSGIVRQYLPWGDPARKASWTVVENRLDGQKVETAFYVLARDDANSSVHLLLLAVVPAQRNRRHGSRIVEHLLENLAAGEDLVVHCTKYARAMQHILKRHRLRRNRTCAAPQIEEYHSAPGSLT